MKFLAIMFSFVSTFAYGQYNEPNLAPGQTKEMFKTEVILGGETFYSENVTTAVPFGKNTGPRFNATFNEYGIKIGNQKFSAKLLPLTVKLTYSGEDNLDQVDLKTLSQRIRGEVARFFFHPEGSDLFINVGTIAFDYKKIGPQALNPAGVEVTQMDVADLNIGYRVETVDGKLQMIFSGYAALQMVNVHDSDFLDQNNQLLGKNVAGTYGVSVWGNYDNKIVANISYYHQQSKLENRDFIVGDNLTWSHHNFAAQLEFNLGNLINQKLAPISLVTKFNYNVATINNSAPNMKPVSAQRINQNSFEVGIKIRIGGGKKKNKVPKEF